MLELYLKAELEGENLLLLVVLSLFDAFKDMGNTLLFDEVLLFELEIE